MTGGRERKNPADLSKMLCSNTSGYVGVRLHQMRENEAERQHSRSPDCKRLMPAGAGANIRSVWNANWLILRNFCGLRDVISQTFDFFLFPKEISGV